MPDNELALSNYFKMKRKDIAAGYYIPNITCF